MITEAMNYDSLVETTMQILNKKHGEPTDEELFQGCFILCPTLAHMQALISNEEAIEFVGDGRLVAITVGFKKENNPAVYAGFLMEAISKWKQGRN